MTFTSLLDLDEYLKISTQNKYGCTYAVRVFSGEWLEPVGQHRVLCTNSISQLIYKGKSVQFRQDSIALVDAEKNGDIVAIRAILPITTDEADHLDLSDFVGGEVIDDVKQYEALVTKGHEWLHFPGNSYLCRPNHKLVGNGGSKAVMVPMLTLKRAQA